MRGSRTNNADDSSITAMAGGDVNRIRSTAGVRHAAAHRKVGGDEPRHVAPSA